MPDTQKLFFLHFFIMMKPLLDVNLNDSLLKPSYSGKIKVSTRKITSTFGLSNAVAQQIYEYVGKKSTICLSDNIIDRKS